MNKTIFRENIPGTRLVIAVVILWPFYFSCTAQTSPYSFLEPAPGSPISMECSPGNLAVGDLNNDGIPDLVLACGQTRSLIIYKGIGNGKFDKAAGSPLVLPSPPNEIVIGDMNTDGHADLTVGSHDSYSVLILTDDGNGNFIIQPNSSVTMRAGSHPHTHGLGIGDLNSDGYIDIVTANSSDNDISVMLNSGRGGFIPAAGSPFIVSPAPYPLTIGDVNSDKHLDIVSTSTNSSNGTLSILLGDGRGQFLRKDLRLRTPNPWFVAIGDINKDRIPDLVATHSERSELTVLLGSVSGQFTEVSASPFNLGSSAWHVAIADLDRDSNPDVVAAANNRLQVMRGDGLGGFVSAPGSTILTGKGTWHLAFSDLNGDGKPDVVTSNLESNNISVLLGK